MILGAALLIAFGCVACYLTGKLVGYEEGLDDGYDAGAADIDTAIENAFRAGFAACKNSSAAMEMDSDHVDAQRERGREGLQ